MVRPGHGGENAMGTVLELSEETYHQLADLARSGP